MIDGQFRDDLDVSNIVIHYRVLSETVEPGEGFSAEDLVEVKEQYEALTQEPQTYGNGPLLASSCVALVPTYPPLLCWDVNGYYRSLGVDFRASRQELREAYQRLRGDNSEYLTYVLKKLLDPEVRRFYDLLPMGSLYMDDKYVQERIKRACFMEAARRTAAGFHTTPQAILIEWGFVQNEDEEEFFLEDSENDLELSEEDVILSEWVYSYYLWKSAPMEHRLEEWQTLIISALAELGIVTRFAVGLIGGVGHLYQKIDDIHVFFLDIHNQPTPHMATEVATIFKEYNGI